MSDEHRLGAGWDDSTPSEAVLVSTSRLLSLARHESVRPVDTLIDRLESSDGAAWFASRLDDPMFERHGPPVEAFCRGTMSLKQLIAVKEMGKAAQSAPSPEDRRGGTLAYFLAVAAALAHHRTLISSRDRQDVNLVLIELATVLPEPWADLMCAAVES